MGMRDKLAKGTKEEQEHAPTCAWLRGYLAQYGELPKDELVYLHIAMDHLAKDREYYSKLEAIE